MSSANHSNNSNHGPRNNGGKPNPNTPMSKIKYILSVIALIIIVGFYLYNNFIVSDDTSNPVQTGSVTNTPEQSSDPTPEPTAAPTAAPTATSTPAPIPTEVPQITYRFRNNKLLTEHYEKHGIEMGFDSKESYEQAASDVINNPAALHKTEKEDNDFVYYVEESNEFVILSVDGYIRTYFNPSAGISYYNRQ